MQGERRTRRGSSRSPLMNGSDQAPDAIVLEGLADYDKAIAEIDAIIAQLEDGQHSLDEEMRLIARLRPRDNLIGQPAPADEEEVPF